MIRLEASYRSINFCIFIILLLILLYADSSQAIEITFEALEITSEKIFIPKDPTYSVGYISNFVTSVKNTLYLLREKLLCIPKPKVPEIEVEIRKLENKNVAVFVFQGHAPTILDRFYIDENFGDGIAVYAIFDGHSNDFAVKYVVENLKKSLKEKIKEVKRNISQPKFKKYLKDYYIDYNIVLEEVIQAVEKTLLETLRKRIDDSVRTIMKKINGHEELVGNKDFTYEELLKDEKIDEVVRNEIREAISAHDSGTTALIALINMGKLFVANVGDSRGVMVNNKGKIQDLSEDHKFTKENEEEPIETSHGEVKCDENSTSVSRTIGDFSKKSLKHIIADPDTSEYDLEKFNPKFILLATNGLWDKLSSKQALELINNKKRLNGELFGTKYIAEEAYKLGSKDTITVIMVKNLKV